MRFIIPLYVTSEELMQYGAPHPHEKFAAPPEDRPRLNNTFIRCFWNGAEAKILFMTPERAVSLFLSHSEYSVNLLIWLRVRAAMGNGRYRLIGKHRLESTVLTEHPTSSWGYDGRTVKLTSCTCRHGMQSSGVYCSPPLAPRSVPRPYSHTICALDMTSLNISPTEKKTLTHALTLQHKGMPQLL